MNPRRILPNTLAALRIGLTSAAVMQLSFGATLASAANNHDRSSLTRSPIKHVIVIIGENRSFDHVFATYVPVNGEKVNNLLSQGIIALDANKNAIPGPHFSKAHQLAATDRGGVDPFLMSPPKHEFEDNVLPAPLVGGPKVSYVPTLAAAIAAESGLPEDYYPLLLSGGTGQTSKTPDQRITDVTSLPAGPFQLTNGGAFTYDSYAASPVHRFYQMWQQLDCSVAHATAENPSGCNGKLFSWVEVTTGAGTNGNAQPPLCSTDGDVTPCFTTNYLSAVPNAKTTGEGSTALGFYNVQQGDVPYFTMLANNYAMSDNFHQSVDGGTGANHIMFGHGDAIYFTDADGKAAPPPDGLEVYATYQGAANPSAGVVNEVENPNPAPGTNNWFSQDGYGVDGNEGYPSSDWTTSPVSGGGSYSDCSDTQQPGVGPVVEYLRSLSPAIEPRCEKGHYYLLNNYNPGYFGNGKNAYTDTNPANTPFTIPPSNVPSIGDDLNANGISWRYYGDQWDNYVPDPYDLNYGVPGASADDYCTICNPFQYDTSIMADPEQRKTHIQDSKNLYADISNGTLPAVSIVKPSGLVDGHPSSSKLDLFEGFVKKIVDEVQASPYAADTSIFITFDEGGGYYDSGYVQPLDFFGDGTRIPLIVVAPYTKPGHISHEYTDHVSILKFIERNWGIGTVTKRSRDNFPNPTVSAANPYVPTNSPALGDLFDLFSFPPSH
jgi:phospholipase C